MSDNMNYMLLMIVFTTVTVSLSLITDDSTTTSFVSTVRSCKTASLSQGMFSLCLIAIILQTALAAITPANWCTLMIALPYFFGSMLSKVQLVIPYRATFFLMYGMLSKVCGIRITLCYWKCCMCLEIQLVIKAQHISCYTACFLMHNLLSVIQLDFLRNLVLWLPVIRALLTWNVRSQVIVHFVKLDVSLSVYSVYSATCAFECLFVSLLVWCGSLLYIAT